jgi:alanine-glyoxylate transaminase/serine-glyoxylate transaminase/serine-pyruvate transaminase
MAQIPPVLIPPQRVLLGPGPSESAPSVLAALGRPTLGHLDPRFLAIMDEVRGMLRQVLRTRNELTFPVSGTGTAGMETVLVNLIEPGDEVLVCVIGYFGARMVQIAKRAGAKVTEVHAPWGRAIDPAAVREAAAGRGFKLLAFVHGETSTGVVQEVAPLAEIARSLGALLVVDCITSVAGVPVELDLWGIDAAYTGTQKCLACPPGLSPVSLSARAMEVLSARKTPVQSWYLDLSLVKTYWGAERAYHHTAPINMVYGLHEALRLALEEGLEIRWQRHATNAAALWAGLEAMGLELLVPAVERLIPLTSVKIPAGVDDAELRRHLLAEFSIEIGAGLGPLKGKVWRIGLMGVGSHRRNVDLVLAALCSGLRAQGHEPERDPQAAVSARFAR